MKYSGTYDIAAKVLKCSFSQCCANCLDGLCNSVEPKCRTIPTGHHVGSEKKFAFSDIHWHCNSNECVLYCIVLYCRASSPSFTAYRS